MLSVAILSISSFTFLFLLIAYLIQFKALGVLLKAKEGLLARSRAAKEKHTRLKLTEAYLVRQVCKILRGRKSIVTVLKLLQFRIKRLLVLHKINRYSKKVARINKLLKLLE